MNSAYDYIEEAIYQIGEIVDVDRSFEDMGYMLYDNVENILRLLKAALEALRKGGE